jgi:hypothetical protein
MDNPPLPQRRVWGERRPKDRLTLQIILVFTLTCLETFTCGRVSVFDKYLHWPCVSVKKLEYVHVNDLHLHLIYMQYIWLLTLTRTTLAITQHKNL